MGLPFTVVPVILRLSTNLMVFAVLATPLNSQSVSSRPLTWDSGRPLTLSTEAALVLPQLVRRNGPKTGGVLPVWLL